MPSNIIITPASGLIAFTSSSGNTQNINQNSNGTITFSGATTGVGIGTASPVGALHIVSNNQNLASDAASSYTNAKFRLDPFNTSSIGVSMGLISPNINYIQASYNNGTTAALSINPYGGNVGIGATPDNTYQGLTIYGSNPSLRLKGSNGSSWTWIEFATSGGTNNFSMGVNQTIPQFVIKAGAGLDSPSFTMSSTGVATFTNDVILPYSKSLAFNSVANQYITADATGIALGTANLARLFINTSGNVGIGTTSPLQTSTNRTVLTINGTTNTILNLSAGGTLTSYWYADAGGSTFETIGTNIISASGANSINFNTNGSERMRITSGGNVGIGTTSALQTLTLAGTQMMYNTGGDGVANTVIGSITSQVRNYGTGIATSSFASIQFATDPTTWYKGDIRFLTNGSDGTSTGGSEKMRITSGGNVGIKNTSPSGLLEIGVVNDNSTYGGHFFSTFQIPVDTWSLIFYVPSNNQWNAITEFTWTSSGDYNRSGAAYMRWAYEAGAATLGVVYTLFNNSQNATATFRKSGNEIQIYITGGVAPYYVQARIQGSRAS